MHNILLKIDPADGVSSQVVLDLQDFSKGIEKNETNGQEIIGGENRSENAPAQKNKDTKILKGRKIMNETGTSS